MMKQKSYLESIRYFEEIVAKAPKAIVSKSNAATDKKRVDRRLKGATAMIGWVYSEIAMQKFEKSKELEGDTEHLESLIRDYKVAIDLRDQSDSTILR